MASGLGSRARLATPLICSSSVKVRNLKQAVDCGGFFEPNFSNVIYVVITYNLPLELLLKKH